MIKPKRIDPRVFPSETGWLLVLLAAMILLNAWFVADWWADLSGQADSGSPAWHGIAMFVSPGSALYVWYAWLRVRQSEPLLGTQFYAAGKVINELVSRSWTSPKEQCLKPVDEQDRGGVVPSRSS